MAKLSKGIKSLLGSALKILKRACRYGLAIAAVISAGYLIMNADQLQRDYLRATVGSKVVRIVRLDEKGDVRGGGTGFLVKAPSGTSYILTNSHVCAMAVAGELIVEMPGGNLLSRRVVQDSDWTDLCLVEGLPGQEGLELAGSYDVGEMVAAVGHPHLMPLTISKGEIVSHTETTYLSGIIGFGKEEKDCQRKYNKIEDLDTFFGPIRVCTVTVKSLQTTIVGLPGNSGSPIVNAYGHLVGVLFAGDNDVHWSMIVPLEDINKFLKAY